ncbi:membrane transport protein mmpL8 [Candidatus Kuenenia stuttgartiensis]|uniref:Membrane transport protein mmpL8 n=2 Tax=Candidatus Brocadiaceae TaxID=1127830 RepID=Q1Q265_KUEST|nr:MMPL family transporter [Candidatus Kuenenia stuttgartiensis]MCF6150911.1 hypothetical protein [Candidatus Kuenenia stuttgartiensis]QII11128.1 membrane transport protein mmpL8 [Candidatus Kuenenia stuttgartiensis]CAJ74098.1 hypothetical protein kuste3337 [Candidatus Kuenenia stuttgartiensis]SOH03306.1 Membrane transport protein mmpL8 [Candidatus Kuenenia stuttgartiensis]
MEFFLKKCASFIHSFHKQIVVVFALLTAVSIVTIFYMEIKTDIIDVLPSKNKKVGQFKDFIEKYGISDNVVLLLESTENEIDEQTELIETLANKLAASPYIEHVDYSPLKYENSFFINHIPLLLDEKGLKRLENRLTPKGIERQIRYNLQKLLSPLSSPIDYEMISKDPLDIADIVKDSLMSANKEDSLDISTGYYITSDYSTAVIFVKPKGKGRDMAFVGNLKRELDDIISFSMEKAGNPSDVRVELTGNCVLSEEVRQIIRHDVAYSFLLSVFLIAALIWFAYRVRVKILLVIGFTLLTSLSTTLAFAYLVFGSLNIVTSVVAALLIGLYVDYAMHSVNRFGEVFRKLNNRQKALEQTLTKTGSAIIISASTTSLSFFSIIVTKFNGLHELGIVAGIGVLLCLLSTLFLTNSLLYWISKKGLHKIQLKKEVPTGVENLIKLLVKRPNRILAISIIVFIIAGFGVTRLKFNNDPDSIIPKDCSSVAVGKKLQKKMGNKGEPLSIVIKALDKKGLSFAFDELEKLLMQLKENGLIKDYNSLNIFMPAPSVQLERKRKIKTMLADNDIQPDALTKTLLDSLEKNKLVYEKTYVNNYIKNVTNALYNAQSIGLEDVEMLSSPRVKHFYNKEDLSIASYIYQGNNGWDIETINKIQQMVDSKGQNWIFTGKPILFNEIKPTIIWGSALASIMALLMNFVIIYLYFRKILHTIFVLLPVTLGFLLTLGAMAFLGIPFNVINVGTIALVFGLGVDYGIYVMQAYVREDEKNIYSALRTSGKNVMMCSATTVAGCGSLALAKFTGIATVGLVLSIGAIACAITALLVLPTIIYLNERRISQ